MKKGFTLLELVVVIIVIAILASLGFSQYTKMLEKGRAAEARTILGQLRTAEIAYYLEYNVYAAVDQTNGNPLPIDVPLACNTSYFFYYLCGSFDGRCSGIRCQTGGKSPQGPTNYYIYLNPDGTWGGTTGYY